MFSCDLLGVVVAFIPCRRTRAALGYNFERCMQLHLPPCRVYSCASSFLAHLEKLLVARVGREGVIVYYPQDNIKIAVSYETTEFRFRITVVTKVTLEIRLQVTLHATVSTWGYTFGKGSMSRFVEFRNHEHVTNFRPVLDDDEDEEDENASVYTWTYRNYSDIFYEFSESDQLRNFVSEGGQVVPLQEYVMSRVKLYGNTL